MFISQETRDIGLSGANPDRSSRRFVNPIGRMSSSRSSRRTGPATELQVGLLCEAGDHQPGMIPVGSCIWMNMALQAYLREALRYIYNAMYTAGRITSGVGRGHM